MDTPLCKLFKEYGADKHPDYRHSYSAEYYNILSPFQKDFKNILEVGVGTSELMQRYLPSSKVYKPGASLRAWRDFFSNAHIYGIDIEKEVLFQEDRINCFYTDQSSSSELKKTLEEICKHSKNPSLKYDFILDDGSHVIEHMLVTFQTLKEHLTTGGVYIIEDIKREDLDIFKNLADDTYQLHYVYDGKDDWDSFVAYIKK